jgi:hypothetical protein
MIPAADESPESEPLLIRAERFLAVASIFSLVDNHSTALITSSPQYAKQAVYQNDKRLQKAAHVPQRP